MLWQTLNSEIKLPKLSGKDLNTFMLERWTNPYGNKEEFFVNWSIRLDGFNELKDELFALESKQRSWWENYQNITFQITEFDWTKRECMIPWVVIWWMWTWVSSSSLIETASKVWVWWHLSSIAIWWSYEEPDVYSKWAEFNIAFFKVETEFNTIFKEKLWLTDNQINKHLFECNENQDWIELDENFWLFGSRKEKMFRMKDLIAIYNQATELKSKWISFWINAMYKTTSYVAVLKVSTLAWIDYITTAAWNPNIHPKRIVTNFLQDTWKTDIRMPAFWLIVSIVRWAVDLEYDYFIIEDPRFAWWHLWATASMLERIPRKIWKEENLTSLRKKVWPDKPIIVAWWFNSTVNIRAVFDAWANWIQIWTTAAVSDEAVSWGWEDFKNALISWNHIWPREEIDNIAEKEYLLLKENLYKIIWETRQRLFDISPEQLCNPKTLKVLRHIHKIVFWNFNKWNVWWIDFWNVDSWELEWEDAILFDQVWWFLHKQFEDNNNEKHNPVSRWLKRIWKKAKSLVWIKNNNELLLNESLRRYWNMLKLAEQFIKFDEQWIIPTHIVFDSVVWFDARKRLWKDDWKICWEVIDTRSCVWCLNACLLAWRWEKWIPWLPDSTAFCIVEWLKQWDKTRKLPINFSWTTTVPYPEIRPFSHILAAMLWYEVTI